MNLRKLAVPLIAFAALLTVGPGPVDAHDGGVMRMDILVDGRPLAEHRARGAVYVEALKGKEYSIRLTNTQPVRIAVALAVDGRNTIDAKRTDASKASKWVLDPHETIEISGWQTSTTAAHRFVFTSEQKSYAAWLGDTSNLGVIEAVAYREKPRPVTRYTPPRDPRPDPMPMEPRMDEMEGDSVGEAYGGRLGSSPGGSGKTAADAPAPRSSDADGALAAESRSPRKEKRERRSRDLRPEKPADEYAATGFGRETSHRVEQVHFEIEDSPAGSVRLRYEYRDALVRLGVLPAADPLTRRESAGGFSDSSFAPIP